MALSSDLKTSLHRLFLKSQENFKTDICIYKHL